MEIITLKSFDKSFKKLQKEDKILVQKAMEKFIINPSNPSLKNHPLKGNRQGEWSISAGFDLRILYREEWDHTIVYLIKTGSHNQVY